MYAIYGDIYHQYTPNVSIYTIHGSYGYKPSSILSGKSCLMMNFSPDQHGQFGGCAEADTDLHG
jgi:hypothetical protein